MRTASSTAFLLAACLLALPGAGCAPQAPEGPDAPSPAAPTLRNGSFTADLNGFLIHYEVHGSGPVLMTVPNSWGLTLQGLRALYHPLERDLTLVYFDPRGMGGSGPVREDADMGLAAVRADFEALRRHLGLDKVHAIGWSNGAGNLILLASEHPESLSSAIFLHGTARFQEEDMERLAPAHQELFRKWGEMQERMEREGLPEEDRTRELRRFYMEGFFPAAFADPEAAREILPRVYADTRFSYRHSAYAGREMPTFDLRDRLPRITVPSLVIAGAHDMMPPERAREIHEGIPDSRFLVFHDSGHFAPLEEPELFAAAVVGFLGEGRP